MKISDLVLHNDHQIVILNKPAGLPSQSDLTGDQDLHALAQMYCKVPLHLMSRLDRPVSGCVMMSKNKESNKSLQDQLQSSSFVKTYLAIVHKSEVSDKDTLSHHLVKIGEKRKALCFDEAQKGSKEVYLDYVILAKYDNYDLVQITPHTGRFHQIRSQLSKVGMYIKGDVKYGAKRKNRDRSISLHAWKVSFKHPTLNKPMTISSSLPDNDGVWKAAQKTISEL